MEWPSILTIVLGSSFLGAALTNLVGWQIKHSEKNNQATFLALTLAHIFEKYAYECLSAAEDHETAKSSDGYAGSYANKIPKFLELPKLDYLVLAPEIIDDTFDFPLQVSFASEALSSAFDFLDSEDAVEQGYKSCLKLAVKSLDLADKIRHKYALQKRKLEFEGYSVRNLISEKLKSTS